jgi:photosystem II stability/assembly factor-like uncharacterized protein
LEPAQRASALRSDRRRGAARRGALAGALAAALTLIGLALSAGPVTAAGEFTPPPVRHVWVINLENTSYAQTFEDGGNFFGAEVKPHPYLKNVLPSRGMLLRQYYGIGHNSLPNYIAQISGQAPNPDMQGDCLTGGSTEFVSAGTDPHGQAIGQGCFFPASVKTIADQLDAKGMTWKGYMEDLGNTGHPDSTGDSEPCNRGLNYQSTDLYAAKHDPYVWFHSLADQPSCGQRDLPLPALGDDLGSIATTPNLSFISPNLCNDGHDCDMDVVDTWLKRWVPVILASPAYRQDGMLVVTFDEASSFIGISGADDTAACCNEIPGPNSPMPGESGPGGGRVGAVILSPFVKPGTTSDHPYNHYSLLRSMEDAFGFTTGGDDGQGHLGFAGSYDPTYPGPGSFGCDVYTAYGPCQNPVQPAGPAPASAAGGPSTGPRPADGSAIWRNPLPGSNDLAAISCTSASACVAVGQAGTIVSTTDSGATWSQRSSGSAADLAGVSCASPSTCVAVGDGGTILASGDGGATWTIRQSGTASGLNAVSCATASSCSAVGDGGTIVASADGGQTWNAQNSGTSAPLLGVSCPDASTCYADGDVYVSHEGTIPTTTSHSTGFLETSDRGATWRLRDTGTSGRRLHSISCPSPTVCFAGGDDEAVLTTVNGGDSWLQKFATGMRSLGIACGSPTDCVAVGTRLTPFGVTPANSGVASTSDGGQTFTRQDPGTADDLHGVSCPTAATCYAVGNRGTIVARTDGVHWSTRTQTATPLAGSPQKPPHQSPQLFGARCPTTSTCFAVGDDGRILRSADAGNHWSAQASGTDARLYAVGCATATDCVATGEDGTIVGTSTGATWAPHSSGTREALAGASCPTTSACFAVGDRGTVLATTNHGATWHAQSSKTNANLNAVSCSSASTCVAVGSLGTILRTTNGGSTWTSLSSGTAAYLGGVSCPSAKICIAVGQDGLVLTTGNEGKSWTARRPLGNELGAVSCASTSNCVATGSAGAVISSADGGGTWTVQGTGTARSLTAVSCPSTTSCVAAGDTGTVLGITPRAVRPRHGR